MTIKFVNTRETRYFLLGDLVARKSQSEVARMLGCSQAYISKTLKSNRQIYICVNGDGTARGVELTPYPNKNPRLKREFPVSILARRNSGD